MRKLLASLIVLLLVLSILGCGTKSSLRVENVTDGDSFTLTNGEEVRLIGIDAPEASEPGADIAKSFLEKMIIGKELRLEKDTTNRDKYNRLLRYVYVGNVFVNAGMIKNGYAIARFYPPDEKYKSDFVALQKNAEQFKKGLWAIGGVFPPSKVSETRPEDIISWQDASKYYGKTKTVEGTIVKTYNSGKACFLNFHPDYKTHFTAVIFASDFSKFSTPPEEFYLNKDVRIRGLIKEYQDKPQIVVTNPSQIEIVKKNK